MKRTVPDVNATMPATKIVVADVSEKLGRLHRADLNAIAILVDMALEREAESQTKERAGTPLIDKLRAWHECPKDPAPGFIQLPRSGGGSRSWECQGCGLIIHPGWKGGA